jgi:Transcriptional regulator, AbiEi antitoxin
LQFHAVVAALCKLTRGSGGELDVKRHMDGQVARIAGRQRTMVTTEQLRACGLGKDAIRYRIRSGQLTVVFRGVHSLLSGELPPLAREQAALLACGEHAFLSHYTAAFIWGLRPIHPRDVEVTVVGRYVRSRAGLRVHQIRAIDRREVRPHEGLWVSSPARALLELAPKLSGTELADAVGEAVRQRLVKRRDVDAVLARHRGCRGAARLAGVIR